MNMLTNASGLPQPIQTYQDTPNIMQIYKRSGSIPNPLQEYGRIREKRTPYNITPPIQVENTPRPIKKNRQLLTFSTQFPWNIFPCIVSIGECHVHVDYKEFLSRRAYSIDIKDIANVSIGYSLLNANLQIVSRTFTNNVIQVPHLKTSDVKLAKKIIDGLRFYTENQVNTSQYTEQELIEELKNLNPN